MRWTRRVGTALLLPLLAGVPAPSALPDDGAPTRSTLSTVEGEVVSLAEVPGPGEGELPVVSATLRTGEGEGEELSVLLAPRRSLEEIGFEVREGDRLRARVFTPEEGPAKAHKVRNLTRDTMIRFRTLRQVPIWDRHGSWQGGPGMHRGEHGRHGPGGGPRR